jgi:hypothetical protein
MASSLRLLPIGQRAVLDQIIKSDQCASRPDKVAVDHLSLNAVGLYLLSGAYRRTGKASAVNSL